MGLTRTFVNHGDAAMFFLSYIASELRRRRARTILTALGLAVGVALVISVSALSNGLDNAQQKVLQPLTGVGTDMTVTRPIKVSSGGRSGSVGSRHPSGVAFGAKGTPAA